MYNSSMTMDLGTAIQWSDQVELYLKDIGEKSHAYSYLHKASERLYDYKRMYIDLPSITLSTICGTLSIGNSSLFGQSNEQLAGVVIGCGSLLVGLLGTVNSYFGWGKRAENHRLTHLQYGKLFRFIQIELSLPREQRMGCPDLLKYVRETYERLQEISPIVPQHIIQRFMTKFKTYKGKVSFPTETNGLEVVEIYVKPTVFSDIMDDERRKSVHSDVHGTVPSVPSVRTEPGSPPPGHPAARGAHQLFPLSPTPSGDSGIQLAAPGPGVGIGRRGTQRAVQRGAGYPDAVVEMPPLTTNDSRGMAAVATKASLLIKTPTSAVSRASPTSFTDAGSERNRVVSVEASTDSDSSGDTVVDL